MKNWAKALLFLIVFTAIGAYAVDYCKAILSALAGDKYTRLPFADRDSFRGQLRRYIETAKISEDWLPYRNQLRPARASRHENLTLDSAEYLILESVTDIRLTSPIASGNQESDVRIAYLMDGTPVALKTYREQDRMLDEAKSAEFMDALGIGPRFHGLYRDKLDNINIVMDIVAGEHIDMNRGESVFPVTMQTLADLEEILSRLKNAGIKSLQEFQIYITPSSRLVAIDPDYLAARLSADYVDENGRDWIGLNLAHYIRSLRLSVIKKVSSPLRAQYLRNLSEKEPEAAIELTTRLNEQSER